MRPCKVSLSVTSLTAPQAPGGRRQGGIDSAPHRSHTRQMSATLESAIGDAIYGLVQKYRAAKKQAEIDRVVKALLDTVA